MDTKMCAVEACPRNAYARGYCKTHVHRLYMTGSVQADKPIIPSKKSCIGKKCSIEGCYREQYGKGLCNKHWSNLKRNGKVLETRRDPRPAIVEGDIAKIPLGVEAKDGYAIVDIEDAWVDKYYWSRSAQEYPMAHIDGKNMTLHKYLVPSSHKVDHEDTNRLNNRRSNLRICTDAQNAFNRGKQSNNTSGFKGVFLHKDRGTYYVRISAFGKDYIKCGFRTAKEAALVYNHKAIELHGEFARLNVI